MTAVGAQFLASWIAGNPPLQTLDISSECDASTHSTAGVGRTRMTLFPAWQAIRALVMTA